MCACVCVCVCVCVYGGVCMYVWVYVCVCVYMCVWNNIYWFRLGSCPDIVQMLRSVLTATAAETRRKKDEATNRSEEVKSKKAQKASARR